MHSNDLREMNGCDIEDVAGETGRFRQFTWNELSGIMDYLQRLSMRALQPH